MLATAIEEINSTPSPVMLDVDRASAQVAIGRFNGISAAVWGRVQNPDGRELSADQLCERVSTAGGEGLQGLRGHYALVVSDPLRGKAWVMADRFVTHRLYYTVVDGRLWVSDSLARLKKRLPDTPELSLQALLSYLYFHMIPSPETLYHGIFALAPADLISFSNGQLTRRRHWHPELAVESGEGEQQLAEALFKTLDQAVAEQLNRPDMGCFLSGGLDSSSIAGLVARHRPRPKAFSIGFPLEQYNELDYARCAVANFDLDGHEYTMCPEDVVAALPKVVASMDQPFGNSSVLPTFFCAELAREQGVGCLVAGDGGDELFAGNARYAHQLRLDRWRRRLGPLVGLLDRGLLKSSWPEGPALLRKARSFTRQLKMSIPENLEYYNFLNLLDRDSLLSSTVAGAVDLYAPDARCQALYDELPEADALERMLYMDWKHTLADNDLVKVSSMCRLAGVEVVYPMLDDNLVDLSLRIPGKLKLTPGNLRHLYKQAMQGFLPDKIIHKPKHGFGLPFGLWTQEHKGLQGLAYEALDSLRGHDFFNPGFVDEVKRLHRQEHAKHYGELVWVLMVLALWLDENR